MSSQWQVLLDDLAAERHVLEDALAHLDEGVWDRASPAEGWTLRDCVAHLAESDEHATASVRGETPSAGERRHRELTAGQRQARSMTTAAVRQWYARANDELLAALRGLNGDERLSWAGHEIGARSFASARLMEHWSHGLDILAAAEIEPVDSERLRHVAHLGYITRDFAYRNRGLTPPETPLRVELESPSGETWTWGPEDAPDVIRGSAGDFCRVVTQRIHPDDTRLTAKSPGAREFLKVAQAFAGPPGPGRPPASR